MSESSKDKDATFINNEGGLGQLTSLLSLAVNIINSYNELTSVKIMRMSESSNDKDATFINNEGGLGQLSSHEGYIEHPPLERVFDQKRTLLKSQQEHEKDCFCPNGRENWIHLTSCSSRAGIKDRQNILRNLMWFADELCAKIALMCNPELWLSEEHGCYAPSSATWDSYFTPVRNILETTTGMDEILVSRKVDLIHWDINPSSTFKGLKRIDQIPSIQAYELGRKLHLEGTPFVWHFNRDFFATDLFSRAHMWPNQKLNHRKYTENCGLVDFDTSEELLNIGQLMLQELNITSSRDFVTLHLRRGDNMMCDTTPDTVLKYLRCSIHDDDIQKILVLTNGDEEYVETLLNLFSKEFPDKEMIILDQFIETESFMEKLNKSNLIPAHLGDIFLKDNCFSFSAEKVLVSMSRYHLERGRKHCTSCDRGGSIRIDGVPLI